MKQGYTVHVSEEARKKHEARAAPTRKKTDCPSCRIKPSGAGKGRNDGACGETDAAADAVAGETPNGQGEK